MVFLNILAIFIFIITLIFVYLIGYDNYSAFDDYGLVMLAFLILWMILHEILHGIGFMIFREVKLKNITYGIALEKGVFYCMCKQKISKKVILTSLLFPLTIIGIITLFIGIKMDNSLLVLLSIYNIMGASGDIIMTCFFLFCPNDIIYLDLDDCTSFTVLSKSDITSIKVPGIKLVDSGIYDNKMTSKDKRHIVISKTSFIILLVIFIIILINFIGGVL